MGQNSFWFSHDYNARNDRKIAALTRDYKSSGYGIYWCVAEMLHEENGALEYDDITICAIAKDLNESAELVSEVIEKCVTKYHLLKIVEAERSTASPASSASKVLISGRVEKNLENQKIQSENKVKAGREGGIKSGLSRRYKNNAKQNEAVLQANEANLEANEQEERRGDKNNTNTHSLINGDSGFLKNGKKFPNYPKEEDVGLLVPETMMPTIIEYYQINKQQKKSPVQVEVAYTLFQQQHFNGKKFYEDERDVLSHFVNTIRREMSGSSEKQFNGNGKLFNSKNSGAQHLLAVIKDEAVKPK